MQLGTKKQSLLVTIVQGLCIIIKNIYIMYIHIEIYFTKYLSDRIAHISISLYGESVGDNIPFHFASSFSVALWRGGWRVS